MKRRPKAASGAARYTVDAAAKALELLSVFRSASRDCRSRELATRTGIPRATAFRLLSTLEAIGLSGQGARRVSSSGSSASCSATSSPAVSICAETAQPHLVALRDATRETTQIAILDHWQVVYLERMLSPLPVGFMRSRGRRHSAGLLHRRSARRCWRSARRRKSETWASDAEASRRSRRGPSRRRRGC